MFRGRERPKRKFHLSVGGTLQQRSVLVPGTLYLNPRISSGDALPKSARISGDTLLVLLLLAPTRGKLLSSLTRWQSPVVPRRPSAGGRFLPLKSRPNFCYTTSARFDRVGLLGRLQSVVRGNKGDILLFYCERWRRDGGSR